MQKERLNYVNRRLLELSLIAESRPLDPVEKEEERILQNERKRMEEKLILKIIWIDYDDRVNDGKEEQYVEIVECDSYKEAMQEYAKRDANQYNGHEIERWVIGPRSYVLGKE